MKVKCHHCSKELVKYQRRLTLRHDDGDEEIFIWTCAECANKEDEIENEIIRVENLEEMNPCHECYEEASFQVKFFFRNNWEEAMTCRKHKDELEQRGFMNEKGSSWIRIKRQLDLNIPDEEEVEEVRNKEPRVEKEDRNRSGDLILKKKEVY